MTTCMTVRLWLLSKLMYVSFLPRIWKVEKLDLKAKRLLPFFGCGLLWLGVCAGGSFGAVWESVSDSQLGQKRRLPFILQPRFPFFYISVSEWKREASFARIAGSLGPFVSVSEG